MRGPVLPVRPPASLSAAGRLVLCPAPCLPGPLLLCPRPARLVSGRSSVSRQARSRCSALPAADVGRGQKEQVYQTVNFFQTVEATKKTIVLFPNPLLSAPAPLLAGWALAAVGWALLAAGCWLLAS